MKPPAEAPDPTRGPGAATPPTDLVGYEVLLCVCGGIAAYKAAAVCSALAQRGCGVSVAMTRAARRFVGRATFQALSGRKVQTSLWPQESGDIHHLKMSETCDLIIVAPATANVIGKLACGIADDLVSTLLLGADAPILMAPAMNTRMWQNPAVQRNIELLHNAGVRRIGPNDGWQACRAVGPGRMSEPDEIVTAAVGALRERTPRNAMRSA